MSDVNQLHQKSMKSEEYRQACKELAPEFETAQAVVEAGDAALIRACEVANDDREVADIESEFAGIGDDMVEPWK